MRNSRAVLYGYRMENGILILNETEAEIIRKIYADRISGIGVYAIGKDLYERQIPYFSDSRDKACKKVSGILYKSAYSDDGKYPAIISKEDFEKVLAMKADPFREIKSVEEAEESVKITDLKTAYHPNAEVSALETKVHEELENHTLDSVAIREMILSLAARKYDCITQKGEPL